MHESRFGDEDERLMHFVPAPAVILLKRRVLHWPLVLLWDEYGSWKVVPDASLKRLPKAGTMILDPSLSSLSFWWIKRQVPDEGSISGAMIHLEDGSLLNLHFSSLNCIGKWDAWKQRKEMKKSCFQAYCLNIILPMQWRNLQVARGWIDKAMKDRSIFLLVKLKIRSTVWRMREKDLGLIARPLRSSRINHLMATEKKWICWFGKVPQDVDSLSRSSCLIIILLLGWVLSLPHSWS